jgi:hypothetical protein
LSPDGDVHTTVDGSIKRQEGAGHRWLTPAIPAAQEAEIRRITVRSQPRQIVHETLSPKKLQQKRGWWSSLRYRPWVQANTKKKTGSFWAFDNTIVTEIEDSGTLNCGFMVTHILSVTL